MKKLFKIFTYLVIIFILLVIALTITAKLSENKIADLVLKKVSKEIKAPVTIDEVSFNLLRKFPYANIELYGVTLGKIKNEIEDSASTFSDTILRGEKIYVSVKTKPLLANKIEIVKIDINNAVINYEVDTNGQSNIDFLISSSDSTNADTLPSEPLNILLDDFSAYNITCNYKDESLKANAKVKIPELKVNAEIKGEDILAAVVGSVQLSNSSFGGTNLHLMNNTNIKFDLDYENDSVNIKYLKVESDGIKFSLLGSVNLGEEIKTDLRFGGAEMNLDELIKYAPKEIMEEYGIDQVKGKIYLDAVAKGKYSDTEIPQIDLNIDFKEGNLKTNDYPELKNISFKGKASNGILRNNQSTQADFSSVHFETEKSKFDIAFSILDLDQPKYMINVASVIDLVEFNKFIPDSIAQDVRGKIILKFSTKGTLPDSIGEDFTDYLMARTTANIKLEKLNVQLEDLAVNNFSADFNYKPNYFSIHDLSILVPTYNLELSNTSLESDFNGSINDLSSLDLNVKRYNLETKGAEISGNLKLKDLNNPSYDTKTKIVLALEETKALLPDSLLSDLGGKVTIDIDSKATLNMESIADDAIWAAFHSTDIKVLVNDLFAKAYNEPLYHMEQVSGEFRLTPTAISVNHLKGLMAGVEFGMDSTKIENVYNTIVKNKKEKLKVDTRLSLGHLDYTMFAPFLEQDSLQIEEPEEKQESNETVNYTMEIKGAAKIKSLSYDSIYVDNISTLFNVSDSVYIIDQFKFNAFNGSMNTSVKMVLKPDNKSVIETKHSIKNMDIKKLLADFNNFEDYYEPAIKSENLSGLFSTDLYTRFNMMGDSLLMNDIRVRGDFKLEDGGVYNFEPATNLSVVSNIHELDNIKFKTLDSDVFVFKNAIYLPETFISSSALNITAYGMQSFDEDFEYHLEVKLRDVLMGKSKKQKKKEKKADDDYIDDRNMSQLFYLKKGGKTNYGRDNSDSQGKMKNKIKINQTLLNLRFDPGLFNFDTKVYTDK